MTLDIYIPAGHPYYNKSICILTYDNFKIQKDNDKWSTHKFPIWDTIQAEINDGIVIDNQEFYQVQFCQDIWNRFYVSVCDIQKLNEFCNKRNQEMLLTQPLPAKAGRFNVLLKQPKVCSPKVIFFAFTSYLSKS